ncbi:MAG: monovalent cation/H+ antiporter subunit A [Paracoccaceae bacterium]
MALGFIAVLPFLGALLPGLMIRAGRNACAMATGAVTLGALTLLSMQAPAVLGGNVVNFQLAWLPSLGLNANFMLDGLGLMFAGLILAMGLLIILYARFYLSHSDPMAQFYTYLLLFQGAMLGIVLSDNILLLLIFWELTSLSSFLLIGYWKHLPEARQGARMALAVTGTGGLAMIAGMLILGNIAGSYDLSVILTKGAEIRGSEWYLPALVLILLGCFTKSAQFPFHFWLPHAMAAPTPVSAYLHSATMVKAGIFLMARMWPVLSGTEAWFLIVTSAGLLTMLIGAKVALFKDDLKAILAYSTVSHLGLITMLLGIGTKAAASVAMFHIINHATFKAALFMTAGIVDHAAHTRDISRLGGLRKLMPVTFAVALIASLSMAGLPPFNGFLSKEMMLEQTAETRWLGSDWMLGVLATCGALLSVGYSLRFIARAFLGPVRQDYPLQPHDPQAGLWLAPAGLALLVLIIGVIPMTTTAWLVDAATGATVGEVATIQIKHWHGLAAPALWLSIIAIGGGLILLGFYPTLAKLWANAPRPDAKAIFHATVAGLTAVAQRVTDGIHNASLARAIAIAVLTIVSLSIWVFASGEHLPGNRTPTPVPPVVFAGFLLTAASISVIVARHHNRFLSLIFVGVIGLMISAGFAWMSAPDLALTQLTVEVVTVLLMLLALNLLPMSTPIESSTLRKIRDAAVAVAAGLTTAALTAAIMLRDAAFPTIAAFHLAQSKPGAGGTNAVNTIIVDFRGYDTYGEIIVLGIAALIIFALVDALPKYLPVNNEPRRSGGGTRYAGDRNPLMFVVATRLLLPIAILIGIFIYLRGHNLPGGGFIAGLIVSIAFLMQYMASGVASTTGQQRVDYHAVIGSGVLIAGFAGIGAWAFGLPFLTSGFSYVNIWPLEQFELATAAIFDLGVFLTVLGAVLLSLWSFSRLYALGRRSVTMQSPGSETSDGQVL